MKTPPHAISSEVPVFHKVFSFYERWYALTKTFPKQDRFLIGTKVDTLLLESLVSLQRAGYAIRNEKHPFIRQATHNLDVVKLILRLAYRKK